MAAPDQLYPVEPVEPHGKFLNRHGQKFFLKAMRLHGLGTASGFEQQLAMVRRLDELRRAHTTALVLEAPAEPLLELAAKAGLYALVELRVRAQDVLSRRGLRAALSSISGQIRSLRGHRALIGYLVDCPIEPGVLRCYGIERARRRLARVLALLHALDSRRMVALTHRPDTVGLSLPDEDLIYAKIPPWAPGELYSGIVRLHNLAEARPLVVEFDEGLERQDEIVACAFGLGAAGVVAAPVHHHASAAHNPLAIKLLQSTELLPFISLNGSCPPQPPAPPMVSVIICAYNAERTMRACLESLQRLDYPNFEVIIIDDGSRDATAKIAAAFPEFRLVRQPNKGLSAARNVGLHAARGELVAYTDSDCVVDTHWLSFMARALSEGGFDGCGGPNYAPHEPGWVEGCVAAAPGAPSHVLIGDDRAEHLAGCNMVFRKPALLEVGGFDPQFTAAGDDVDICWRLSDTGLRLGYCPAAFVWHFRRNTIEAYYGQQRGYGKAEALLYFKYPERFNALGQIKWRGIIPGLTRTMPGGSRPRIGWTRHTGQLQQVAERPLNILRVMPLTAEWNLAALSGLLIAIAAGLTIIPALAALAAGPLWALYYAEKAPLEKCHRGLGARLLVAWLAYSGPLVRTIARVRYRGAARPMPLFDMPPRQHAAIDGIRRQVRLTYWNRAYTTRERLLERLVRFFRAHRVPVREDSGWNNFDLMVEPARFSRIEFRTADEELGGMEIRTNVAARLRLRPAAAAGLAACAAGAIGAAVLAAPLFAAILGLAAGLGTISATAELIESGRLAYRAIEQCSSELNLIPLGRAVNAANQPPVENPAGAKVESSGAAQPAGR